MPIFSAQNSTQTQPLRERQTYKLTIRLSLAIFFIREVHWRAVEGHGRQCVGKTYLAADTLTNCPHFRQLLGKANMAQSSCSSFLLLVNEHCILGVGRTLDGLLLVGVYTVIYSIYLRKYSSMHRSLAPCVLVYFVLLEKTFWVWGIYKEQEFVSYSSSGCEVQGWGGISGEGLVTAPSHNWGQEGGTQNRCRRRKESVAHTVTRTQSFSTHSWEGHWHI